MHVINLEPFFSILGIFVGVFFCRAITILFRISYCYIVTVYTWYIPNVCWYLYIIIKVCRQSRKTFLLLRSADKVGRPLCCCIVFSFLFLYFYFFISFPLSAFCGFSAICHRIFVIFGQLIVNIL